MLKLFVGDNTSDLADYANQHGNSVLITQNNWKKIVNRSKTENIVGHTSLSDIGKITKTETPFYELLLAATTIEYHPPKDKWSDHNDQFSLHNMQRMTEYYLYQVNILKQNVVGLNLDHYTKNIEYLRLWDHRKNNDKNLWISGDSISKGSGVSLDERYGQLVATEFDLPANFIAWGGTSIEWAADQILRSDIRPGDIVIWGLTNEYRLVEWGESNDNHFFQKRIDLHNFESSENGGLALISEENRVYKALTAVDQVENFCNKIGATLILFPLLATEVLRLHLSNKSCYYENPYQHDYKYIDLGTDNLHPGPKQHKVWAEKLIEIIKSGKNNERTVD